MAGNIDYLEPHGMAARAVVPVPTLHHAFGVEIEVVAGVVQQKRDQRAECVHGLAGRRE